MDTILYILYQPFMAENTRLEVANKQQRFNYGLMIRSSALTPKLTTSFFARRINAML